MTDEFQCRGAEFYPLGRELVDSGFSFRCQVRGRSMFPFLRDGDIIQVAPSGIDGLQVGDIIFYRSGDRVLAHRVVGFVSTPAGRSARARGDIFLQEDPPVAGEDLIGRVELVVRQRRRGRHEVSVATGWYRVLGDLVARSQAAHRSLRWLALAWLRLANGRQKLLQAGKGCTQPRTSEVDEKP